MLSGNADLPKIGNLRTLLPEKLINPTRFALDHPDSYDPEKLAAYLQTAARAGSLDVERFKKDWLSEDMQGIWQSINVGDFPQGLDAWATDYAATLDLETKQKSSSFAMLSGGAHPLELPTEAEIAQVVNEFRARHPELKTHVASESSPLPLDVSFGQLDFRVQQDESSGGSEFVVRGAPDTGSLALRKDIIEGIQQSEGKVSLAVLLV
jgi:hypothetical protein